MVLLTKEQKLRVRTLSLEKLTPEPTASLAKSPILQDIPVIQRDLRKTMIISFCLVLMLIGIFLYLR